MIKRLGNRPLALDEGRMVVGVLRNTSLKKKRRDKTEFHEDKIAVN